MGEKKRNKTIQKKLLVNVISVIASSLIILGIVAAFINYKSTLVSLEQTMVETVKLASHTVTHEMEGYERLAREFTFNPVLTSDTSTQSEREAECLKLAERNKLEAVGITDVNGISVWDGISVADRDYFKAAQKTLSSYVSDPVIRKDTGEMNLIISAPVIRDNKFQGIVYIGIDASVLCEIMEGIHIGETGNASMINNAGDTIGYADVQLVLDAYNTQKEAVNDKGLEQLAAVEREVMNGESGFDSYTYGGVKKYAAYSPVDGTPGWGIYIAVAQSEFLKGTFVGIIIVIALSLVTLIAGILVVLQTAKGIVNPIKLCVDRIKLLAEGDIHSEIPVITTGDETQVLAESMKSLIGNMNSVIGDIDYCLVEMSEGNFRVESKEKDSYVGDFSNIVGSLRKLKVTLSGVIGSIMDSAGQVSMGAEQMSMNAQSLAEGATEQAGAVEELTATILEVTEGAKASSHLAQKAYENVNDVMVESEKRNDEMKNLNNAMKRISDTSKEIENIINAIEDIASQTNLLSLNASIEAARAGDAGKGFAIVAEQIGKLADDSAKSAVDTKQLIEKSLQEVEKGDSIASQGVEAFEEIIREMKAFAQTVDEVSKSSQRQAYSLKEVAEGVEQISTVVQSNSAAAEESSATSEELSAQAENLNNLVSKFKC